MLIALCGRTCGDDALWATGGEWCVQRVLLAQLARLARRVCQKEREKRAEAHNSFRARLTARHIIAAFFFLTSCIASVNSYSKRESLVRKRKSPIREDARLSCCCVRWVGVRSLQTPRKSLRCLAAGVFGSVSGLNISCAFVR
jgi:hypothetical protein